MDTAVAAPAPAAAAPAPSLPPHRIHPLRSRDFRLVWSAYSVSAIGSEVTVLALPLAAAVLLGASAWQMGLLVAAGTAPYIGFSLLVGAWIDRLARRRPLLVAADLAAAALLLTVPAAYLLGALTVTQLIVVELLVGMVRVTFRPAFGAHLPDVVPDDGLTEASARLKAAEATAMLAGPGLGGSLVQLLTAPVAVLVDAASFLVSAALLSRVRAPERVGHVPAERRLLRAEIGEGLSHLWRDRRLRAIAGAAANVNFFGLMIFALLVVYLTRAQDFTPVMIAAVTVAGGAGSLMGALVAPRVAHRVGRGRTIVLGSAVFSLGMIAFPAAHGPRWLVLAVLLANEVVVGVAIMLFDVNTGALVLSEVPRDMLARINASLSTVTQGVKALGALAGGALGTAYGLRPALWVSAVGALTTVLWTWFPPLRDADAAVD
jgi:MFS family permease